jgi:hypothetical protein
LIPQILGAPNRIPQWEHLFLTAKGTVTITSSKTGEPSYFLPTSGGFFTVQLLGAFDAETTLPAFGDWTTLTAIATRPMQIITAGGDPVAQDPDFTVQMQ